MLRAVVFDLDGTLIDSTEAIVQSCFHVYDTLNIERPLRKKVVDSIGYPLSEQLAILLGENDDLERYVDIYRKYHKTIACDMTHLLPDVSETLAAFHTAGLKLGFATSKKLSASERILEYLGILHYFASRIGPDEVKHPKPHPEALLRSMEILEVGADEMLFIGDMHFDVRAAQSAGVACIAVATGYNTREELEVLEPTAVCDTLAEAREYVLSHYLVNSAT
jgi:HAD superfamily hydrolase (TIGR01509 family)